MGDAMLIEAEQSFGVARPTRKAHWFDEQCKRAAEEVGRRRAQWLNGGGGTDESCQ